MKILVSHPHGNINSYQTALAFYEQGLLDSFQMGLCSDDKLSRLLSTVSKINSLRLVHRDYRRIAKENRNSHYLWESISSIGRRLKPSGFTRNISWYDALFCGHDWQVSHHVSPSIQAVYCFEDGAKATFDKSQHFNLLKCYEMPAGYYRAVQLNKLLITKEHSNWHFPIKTEPIWKINRKESELDSADVIIFASNWARQTLEHAPANIQKKNIVIVPYGTPAGEICHRTQIPKGPFTILFAGKISIRKGILYLLTAWQKLGLKDAKLQLAGSLDVSIEYIKQYQNVEYLGKLPGELLLMAMKEADLFVFPSLADGFGLVISEAMAAGVPVLTTKNTGGPELITDDVEGWCITSEDENALCQRIEWSFQNRTKLVEMGKLARKKAESWTWQDYRRSLVSKLSSYL